MSQLVRQGTSGECDVRSANCGLKDCLDKDDLILFVSPLNPPQPLFPYSHFRFYPCWWLTSSKLTLIIIPHDTHFSQRGRVWLYRIFQIRKAANHRHAHYDTGFIKQFFSQIHSNYSHPLYQLYKIAMYSYPMTFIWSMVVLH